MKNIFINIFSRDKLLLFAHTLLSDFIDYKNPCKSHQELCWKRTC